MVLLRLILGIFSQDANMPPLPLQPKKCFLELSVLWEGGIMLQFRLSQGISSGCQHVTLHRRIFSIFHNCVKEIDIARGFMLLLLRI